MRMAMKTAGRRQRRSIAKALEVLECVAHDTNQPLDQWDHERVDMNVELIQQAMEQACKHHRRSIADAVHRISEIASQVVEEGIQQANSRNCLGLETEVASSADARIHKAVSQAYVRHSED